MATKTKYIGYLVVEHSDDYEQTLALIQGEHLPPGGVLVWRETACAMFTSSDEAKRAIDRTEHYRLAFNSRDHPEKKSCKIVPVRAVAQP